MLAIVILAGGRSKRFGTNKLIYKIEGENMIKRVFKAASEITQNIYLSVKDRKQADVLLSVCNEFSGVIPDAFKEINGPINGVITSLNTLSCEEVVTIPGDMPFIDSEALSMFIEACKALDVNSGSIYWPSGRVDVLIQYHKREEAAKNASLLTIRGALSRSSDILRASKKACYIPISHLTKNYRTFININTPEDLSKNNIVLSDTMPKIKHVREDFVENFLLATNSLKSDLFVAAECYFYEGQKYEEEELYTLALHAYKDAKSCYEKLNNYPESRKLDMKIEHVESLLNYYR